MQSFQIGEITIEVARKRIKNLHLRVHPFSGEVTISAPLNVSGEFIKNFAHSHLEWIRKHQFKAINRPRETRLQFITGEKLKFLGQDYPIRIIENGGSPKAIKELDSIHLFIKPGMTPAKKHLLIDKFYREQLKELIPVTISKWGKVLGVSVSQFGVKKMKTKWGTCSIRVKRIWLNLELAKINPICLEYIVVHEMVHLIERKHNARFYNILHGHFPQWKSIKSELNKHIIYSE